MKKLFVLMIFATACSFGVAQDWAKKMLEASPRHHEWVVLKNGEREVHTFVAYPETSGKAPVVLVIHENMGLTDWALNVADEFAAHGVIAIAPDLLSGMAPGSGRTKDFADAASAREAIYALPQAQVMGDLDAAAAYAKTIPASNGKLWVAGFCWGGGQSFQYATVNSGLTGAMVFYGTTPADGLEKIQAPVYGFYGGMDGRITTTVPATTDRMKTAGKSYDPVIYEGAGHGFMRGGEDPEATAENKAARDQAWERIARLLGHQHVR